MIKTSLFKRQNRKSNRQTRLVGKKERLQESGHEGTEAHEATGGDLDVGGSASGVGAAATASRRGTGARARASGARAGGAAAGSAGTGSSGGRSKDDSGAVVCADGDSAGLVDSGASASAAEGQGVDTRANGGNVGGKRLRSDNSRLVGDGVGLVGNGSVNRGHAGNDAQRVCLGQESSLGSRVLGRGSVLSRSKGKSHGGDEDGGTHFGGSGVDVCFSGGGCDIKQDACLSD